MSWYERVLAVQGNCGATGKLTEFVKRWASSEVEGMRRRARRPAQEAHELPAARPGGTSFDSLSRSTTGTLQSSTTGGMMTTMRLLQLPAPQQGSPADLDAQPPPPP